MAQIPGRYDVLITEIFADPEPSAGLPNSSFLELQNVSGRPATLKGSFIEIGAASIRISKEYTLDPDSMVIVCSASASASYKKFGNVLPLTGFPALPDAGSTIALFTSDHRTIHAVRYTQKDYRNALKGEGGWSLEMIDPTKPCMGNANWTSSIDPAGGTPGKRNSVYAPIVDEDPPHAKGAYAPDSLHILLDMDKTLDSQTACIPYRYQLDNGLVVNNAEPLPPFFNSIRLALSEPLRKDLIYRLTVTSVMDCSGNAVPPFSTIRTGLAQDPKPGELIINEILFNPKPEGTDHVELLNTGKSIIDAGQIHIGSRNAQGMIRSLIASSSRPFLIFPGDHYVVSEDPEITMHTFLVKEPRLLSDPVNMPSMPDAEGTILITDRQGSVLDELHYDERWHFPLINDPEGVALERIDPKAVTQDAGNWHSASADVGYATPTWRNSQSLGSVEGKGQWTVSPEIFSPDQDGRDDYLTIHYRFQESGWSATVSVYDMAGNLIRCICSNSLCGTEGAFRWDGLNEDRQHPRYGPYILVADAFNRKGIRKVYRTRVVIAGMGR